MWTPSDISEQFRHGKYEDVDDEQRSIIIFAVHHKLQNVYPYKLPEELERYWKGRKGKIFEVASVGQVSIAALYPGPFG